MTDKLIGTKFNLQHSFIKLVEATGATREGENLIRLPQKSGNGHLYESGERPGLKLRLWEFTPDHPVELYDDNISAGKDYSFKILIILDPENCILKKLGLHLQFSHLAQKSVLFISDNINVHFELLAKTCTRLFDIRFNYTWLISHLHKPALKIAPELLQSQHDPIIFLEPLPEKYEMLGDKLSSALIKGDAGSFSVRSLVVTLISDLLRKALNPSSVGSDPRKDHYSKKLVEVEIILNSCLRKDLPNLNIIARQVALSESTLKRHFKEVFGKNIYGYYLEKKMELAKHLLLEKGLSVRQVALDLGYENVSNFIEIFRKNYGYSPGNIKRKGNAELSDESNSEETEIS